MQNETFILFGTAQFNDVIIIDYKTSFYGGGLFVTIAKPQDTNHFIGVKLSSVGKHDIVGMQRKKTRLNISASIYKNPKTEKVLYIVDDATTDFEIL